MTVRCRHEALAAATIALIVWGSGWAAHAQEVPEGGKSWVGHAPKGVRDLNLPPDENDAKGQLAKSPRKSAWVDITSAAGAALRAFVVSPERDSKAGVVILLHDDSGLIEWTRAVADQLAKHGFIAVVPDLLSGKGPNGGGTESLGTKAPETARQLAPDEVIARLNDVRAFSIKRPDANGRVAVVGIGWGGDIAFIYALKQPQLAGVVSFHGATPTDPNLYANPKVPILGLYGGADKKRIDEDVPLAYVTLGDLFTPHVYLDATGNFLRQQHVGANLRATTWGWPETVSFLLRRIN